MTSDDGKWELDISDDGDRCEIYYDNVELMEVRFKSGVIELGTRCTFNHMGIGRVFVCGDLVWPDALRLIAERLGELERRVEEALGNQPPPPQPDRLPYNSPCAKLPD